MTACPHCGQRMLIRAGVKLSPKLADLFDAIAATGNRGLSRETLSWMFYPHHGRRDGANAVKVSINHINDFLAETNIRIRMGHRPFGQYRIIAEERECP